MGLIEIHSHLLPYVDDGVSTKDLSSLVMAAYAEAGFDRLIVTPHLYNPYVSTRTGNIRSMYEWAREEGLKHGLRVYLGGETYVGTSDELQVLPFIGSCVLLEVDYVIEPLFLLNQVYTLLKRGFEVILAHVERYRWFTADSVVAGKLREMGVHFQCNIEGVESGLAKKWLETGMIDVFAGDNHGDVTIPGRLVRALEKHPEVAARMDSLFLDSVNV